MGAGLRIERESGPSAKKRREGEICGGDRDEEEEDEGEDEQMVSVGSNCGIIALEALDCTVCNHPLRPPVLQCASGHVICMSCHRKLRNKDRCYVCSITGGYQRCIVLEKILESVQIPCSNTMYGCTVKTHYLEGADHDKSCPCAPCFCPDPGCHFNGSTAELLDHLTHTDNWPATEFEYGQRFNLQIQEGMHVLYTREDGTLLLVKFTPVPPFGNAVSIMCVDPHAVAGDRKFRCLDLLE
ncbi:hypothetical protein QYE76_049123 [Lolium multiflorum]|uniref:RING-type E3 ubiquitin transferase n=1 Tax=Lolium multiflorum TaxID=4521 RepID=A0AAD8SNM4_LOLMU|nr:hypothetical protein QYE76_049123 [Lolium multiflorum]